MASSIFPITKSGEMTGATSSSPGVSGLVPAPSAGDENKILRGDGTWGTAPAPGTLRVVPFSIGVNSWTLSNNIYVATYSSTYVTATSVEFVEYTDSFRTAIRGDLSWAKATEYGGITFTTTVQPVGTLQGEIRVIDNEDGSVAIVTEQTALPTIRDVPFTVEVSDWAINASGKYEAVFETVYVTSTSHDFVEFDESIENASDGIKVVKAKYDGEVIGLKFVSRRVPAGDISGTVTPLDNADGKIAIALQDTVMPIANGGTGANTLAGAKENLGIIELNNRCIFRPDFANAVKLGASVLNATGKSYTAPSDGILYIRFIVHGTDANPITVVFDIAGASYTYSDNSVTNAYPIEFPLKTGETVSITSSSNLYHVQDHMEFIPYK